LIILKKIEKRFVAKNRYFTIEIFSNDVQKAFNDMLSLCGMHGVEIINTNILESSIKFKLNSRTGLSRDTLIEELSKTDASFEIF